MKSHREILMKRHDLTDTYKDFHNLMLKYYVFCPKTWSTLHKRMDEAFLDSDESLVVLLWKEALDIEDEVYAIYEEEVGKDTEISREDYDDDESYLEASINLALFDLYNPSFNQWLKAVNWDNWRKSVTS